MSAYRVVTAPHDTTARYKVTGPGLPSCRLYTDKQLLDAELDAARLNAAYQAGASSQAARVRELEACVIELLDYYRDAYSARGGKGETPAMIHARALLAQRGKNESTELHAG